MDSEDCDTPTQDGTSQEGSREGKRGKIRRWSEQEHELLVQLVEQLGEDACWATIAEHIPGRTGKQCRERWVNHIGSDIRKGNWTAAEEDHMARLHAQLGPAWTRIATLLGGRTENSVKNHFNALLRSKRLNDKKSSILAQYVRIVRDKTNSGLAAYQEAVGLAAACDETHSLHSQPSSKSKRGSQLTSSMLSHSQQTASQRSVPGLGGSPLASCPSIGMNGLPGIRTGRTNSGALQHQTSFQSQGSPAATKTPMSRVLDPASAVAAAVAAVQVAAQVVGAASAGPSGAAHYLGRNGSMSMGPGMLPGMGMGMELGGGSEGMTDSAQYSSVMAHGMVGPLGNLVPAQSHSGNLALGEDPYGARSVRGAGMGGHGRSAFGNMQGRGADGMVGMTDGDDQYQWQQQDTGCFSENSHLPGMQLGSMDMARQYAYLGAPMEGGGTSVGRAQGISPLSHGSNKQLPAHNHGAAHLLSTQGKLASHCSGVLQQDASQRASHATAALQGQVAQLAGMLRHPTSATMPAAGPSSGTGESKASPEVPIIGSHLADGSMLGQANTAMGEGVRQGMGAAALGQSGSAGSQAAAARQSSLHNSPRVNYADMTPRTSIGLQQQARHEQQLLVKHEQGSPTEEGAGKPVNASPRQQQQQQHILDLAATDAAAPSAASLTLGLQDLVGQNGYNSVFGNPQNGVELGSPLSPPAHTGSTRDAILSGNSMFGTLPGHSSYDLFAAALQTEGSHDPALLGRLSGLSLDAMMSGQLGARNHSFYIKHGGMKASQGTGLLSQQCMLTPYQGNAGPQDLQANSMGMLRSGMGHGTLESHFLGGSIGGGQPVAPIAPGSSGGGFGFDPSLLGDGFDLNMRPLQVRTRKMTAPGDNPHAASGSSLPSFIEQNTPASGAKLLNAPLPAGRLEGSDNGTPTASALNELLFAWGQEPCTPATAVLNMSGQANPESLPPSRNTASRLGQGTLPTVPEHVDGVFEYSTQQGSHEDAFLMGSSNYQSSNALHQMFRPSGFSLDGTHQLEVPPPEVMGDLDIMFDDDEALDEAAAAAGTFQPDSLPSPRQLINYEPQQQLLHAACGGMTPSARGAPQSANGPAMNNGPSSHVYGTDATNTFAGGSHKAGMASPTPLMDARSCHLDTGMTSFGATANMMGSGPAFSLSCSPNLNSGAAPPDVTPTLMAPALGMDSALMHSHMAQRGAAQQQVSLKGMSGKGVANTLAQSTSAMVPTSGPAAAAAALWAGASLQQIGPMASMPTSSGPSATNNNNKRSSTQIWGDAYSPGHSSAKRSHAHATSSPGDPEPAAGCHPLKSNLGSRRMSAWAAANDPYRCASEPGLNGGMQQMSADSTATPHVPGSVHSSPVLHGQARLGFGGGSGYLEPPMVPVGPMEHGSLKPANAAGGSQGLLANTDSTGAASMMEAGMDAASALAWSTVFQQPSMLPQAQPMAQPQHLGQYSSALDSQQYSGTTLVQLGSTMNNQASVGTHVGAMHGSSKLMMTSGRGLPAWDDGLNEFGLHTRSIDMHNGAC